MSKQPCVGFLQESGRGDCFCNRSTGTTLGAGVGAPDLWLEGCRHNQRLLGLPCPLLLKLTNGLFLRKTNKTNMQEDLTETLLPPV